MQRGKRIVEAASESTPAREQGLLVSELCASPCRACFSGSRSVVETRISNASVSQNCRSLNVAHSAADAHARLDSARGRCPRRYNRAEQTRADAPARGTRVARSCVLIIVNAHRRHK